MTNGMLLYIMKLRMNRTTGYLFRIGIVAGTVFAGIFAAGAVRDHNMRLSFLRKGLQERAVMAASFVQPGVEKALRTGDDIMLLLQLESLSRADDVQAAYVLDRSAKVIMHTRTSEWGREYRDPYSRAAVSEGRSLFQEARAPHSFIYSVPVSTSAVLCVSYSAQKMDESMAADSRRFIYGGLTLFIIACLAIYVFSLRPLRKGIASLKAALRGIIPGTGSRIPPLAGECGEIAELVNGLLDRGRTEPSPDTVPSSLLLKAVRAFFAAREGRAVLLDADNRLVAATPSARGFFGLADGEGRHIIELFPPEIIECAREAQQNPGAPARREFKGITVECLAARGDDEQPAGLVITTVPV